MADEKNHVSIPLNAKHEEYTSKKTNKLVKAEVFTGSVKIDGQWYWIKLNPNRSKREGKPDTVWLTVGKSSGKGAREL